jgi:hypothetical protein
MKPKIIRYFNMLEIALAIAIIALGATSIMVLFPVGLAATNAAVTDNNLPDAAEFLLGYLEGRIQANWRDAAGNKTPNAFLSSLAGKPVGHTETFKTTPAIPAIPFIFTHTDPLNNKVFLFEKKIDAEGDTGSTADDVVEFAAVALVWVEYPTYYVNGFTPTALQQTEMRSNMATLCVELSWPVEKSYADREKRLYKLELFNQAYDPTP